jgi:hypothetical protein
LTKFLSDHKDGITTEAATGLLLLITAMPSPACSCGSQRRSHCAISGMQLSAHESIRNEAQST